MSDVPKFIKDFAAAIYPDAPDLAIASFDEEKFIEDATARIRDLERKLSARPEAIARPEALRTEPMAWAVWMPKGHEFDYIVFPDKQDALNEIGFKELEDDALEPLFARSPRGATSE